MNESERKMIELVCRNNIQLRRLYAQHLKFEEELASFKSRSYLSPEEQAKEAQIKKEKLRGKDEIMRLVYEASREMDTQAAVNQ